ncbi:MAG: hypothetical protein Q8910_05430 [Bacteroidota bacterium]|nr:hypothetical protein [Bacteroidota bacterium]MDP4225804.1 hypothetical protein [Bacteroidota bacterium]
MKTNMFQKGCILLLFIGFTALNVMGQGRATPEERAKRQTQQMKESLKLTDAQVQQVDAINLKFALKSDSLFKNRDNDRAQMMEKMKNVQTQKEAELQKVLTPDQFATYQKNQEAMRSRRGQGGQGRPRGEGNFGNSPQMGNPPQNPE